MKLSHVLVAIVFLILGVLCAILYFQAPPGPMTATPADPRPRTVVAEAPPVAPKRDVANPAKPAGFRIETAVNRHGSDYRDYEMEATAGPELCEKACTDDAKCQAFTYVKAGVQGAGPHCWLKNAVPQAYPDKTCVTGVKL